MKSYRTAEFVVLGGLCIVALLIAAPAITAARAEVRDNLRKEDLANMKRGLEQYFNHHKAYVGSPTDQPSCTTSRDGQSWFFGGSSPLIRKRFVDVMPHDIRETESRFYRYCVTEPGQPANGYFLEAQLETREPEGVRFDDDEGRKYYYQVARENEATLYRVCGGSEHLCDPS